MKNFRVPIPICHCYRQNNGGVLLPDETLKTLVWGSPADHRPPVRLHLCGDFRQSDSQTQLNIVSEVVPIRTALISVSDKLGLADLAAGLQQAGVQIYSTGGTRRHLEESGVEVLDVASYTGFPEMLDGRVKTLHPKIFGGILARRDREDHMDAIDEHGIVPFDLVVVNLYPFAATASRPGTTREECIEQIDIGGPSL